MEKHYTLKKAAELIGVTTQTLRNWDNAGKINTIRTLGNQRRIPECEIVRLTGPKDEVLTEIEHEPKRSTVEKQVTNDFPSFVLVNNENYLLMCKDTEVYDITNDMVINEKFLPGCMLKGVMDYHQWMKTRYSRDTNFSSQRLIEQTFGSFDHERIKFDTGAFSLSDCYWIKKQGENVQFLEITPYTGFNPLSNLFVSGKADKRWIDSQTLLKVNTFWEIEPFKLCKALGLENTAEAHVIDEGIVLNNFTSTDVFYESLEQSGIIEEDSDPRDIAVEKFKELAVALFVIDYLVENNERQPDDYGFLRSTATGEYVSMAPYHNFDQIWSGEAAALPNSALQGYRGYISSLCQKAISVSGDFKYGTIIERRAADLLNG